MATLRDKFRGCIAASRIGSAMGAVTEGWMPNDIERQKLFATAIIEKKDRIRAGVPSSDPGQFLTR